MRHAFWGVVAAITFASVSALAAAPPIGDAETKSVLLCTAASSDFRVAFVRAGTPLSGYERSEAFDASVLQKVSEPKPNGDARRTGTRVKYLHCGDVTIDVRDGFYNSNPQGELGAADDFPRLTIIRGANKLEVALLEDSCSDAASGRAQAAWGSTPLQAIEGHRIAGGGYRLTLFKTFCDDHGGKPVTQIVNWP